MNTLFKSVVGLGLFVLAWSCTLPCESAASAPRDVCRRADAGALTADVPFVVVGQTFLREGACSVGVDGGRIELRIDGNTCTGNSGEGLAAPPLPNSVDCAVPALPAGTYTVTGRTFTLPEGADGGLPSCP
ncbi:MAG: hypothetical protein Q8N23_13280 [Archangium sp.]|nr:hypothetical protein [Archangium sp.]MDP3569308.1 hypothetical protein [Archangium sp.]